MSEGQGELSFQTSAENSLTGLAVKYPRRISGEAWGGARGFAFLRFPGKAEDAGLGSAPGGCPPPPWQLASPQHQEHVGVLSPACGLFSSIPGFYPLDASSIPPTW